MYCIICLCWYVTYSKRSKVLCWKATSPLSRSHCSSSICGQHALAPSKARRSYFAKRLFIFPTLTYCLVQDRFMHKWVRLQKDVEGKKLYHFIVFFSLNLVLGSNGREPLDRSRSRDGKRRSLSLLSTNCFYRYCLPSTVRTWTISDKALRQWSRFLMQILGNGSLSPQLSEWIGPRRLCLREIRSDRLEEPIFKVSEMTRLPLVQEGRSMKGRPKNTICLSLQCA